MLSNVLPPRTPFFTGFATGQLTVPMGAGPFSIQVLAGSVTINGQAFASPYAWSCGTATANPITVGASGATTAIAVSWMTL